MYLAVAYAILGIDVNFFANCHLMKHICNECFDNRCTS